MKSEQEQMAEEGIDEALIDKNVKWYINFKIRALKRKLRLFFWISNNKWWSALIFVVCISIGIWISHRINFRHTLENTTGVKIEDNRHDVVTREPQ
jgi:hypothetical protein